jgi:hypothetical protein
MVQKHCCLPQPRPGNSSSGLGTSWHLQCII